MSRLSRRHFIERFLKGSAALGISPLLSDLIMGAFLQKAWAQNSNLPINTKNYIHISLAGGLPRWAFDLPLNPRNSSSEFVAGKFGTAISKTASGMRNIYQVRPHTANGQTLNLPPVWFIPTGSQRFDQTLLPNCTFIRGVDMQINSHDISNSRQTAPNIGGLSINGSMADASQTPIPGVLSPNSSTSRAFKSNKGLAGLFMSPSATNPVSSLLLPFRRFGGYTQLINVGTSAAINQAYEKFDEYAKQRGIASNSLTESYDRAISMMETQIYDLESQFPDTLKRYTDLITLALTNRAPLYTYLPQAFTVNTSDRSFQTDQNVNLSVTNMWDTIKADTVPKFMAVQFAIIELLIKNNLSSSYIMGLPSWENVYSSTTTKNDIGHDHHNTGQFAETFLALNYYRSLLSCLSEFKTQIGTKWNQTLIHISSEWNRNPRVDGFGSDHGVNGSNATLISGMINGPYLIGNIYKTDPLNSSTYPGTWGSAAPWTFPNGEVRELLVTDVAQTITAMLGVRGVTNNGYSLLKSNDGILWSPVKMESKNV